MQTLGTMNTPEIQLLNTIEAANLEKFKDHWLPPDAVIMACALDPSVSKNFTVVNSYFLNYAYAKLFLH